MDLQYNVNLEKLNTLAIPANAKAFCEVSSVDDLALAIQA